MSSEDHYCNWECPIGKQKLDAILRNSESVFDAVTDMHEFICVCRKSCTEYGAHINKQEVQET